MFEPRVDFDINAPRQEKVHVSKKLNDVYHAMIGRCYNEDNPNYRYYGAKGVYVCDAWRKDKDSFFEWALDNGYQEGLHLDKDRLSVDEKYYGPETCMWMSPEENCSRK